MIGNTYFEYLLEGKRLFCTSFPVMAPALMSGALLVFVSAIANFGVPATLGFSSGSYPDYGLRRDDSLPDV